MIRKSRRKRKIRILKRIVFWGIIIFISCTGIYFYRKYKDIQLLQRILFDAIICRIRKIKISHF